MPTYEDETIGHIVYDLRFYAGCKRKPQLVHRARWYQGYVSTWGHAGGAAAVLAKKHRSRTRGQERGFTQEALKTARAGGDLDELIEPEGRDRHSAIWDAW